MRDLVLSLGHNSSAIVVEDGSIICGYEEERLTGIKSDSAYPLQAITECQKIAGRTFDNVFISHWFADQKLRKNKYFDPDHCKSLGAIESLSVNFTHHDAHRYSAESFAKSVKGPFTDRETYHTLVIDGFGSYGECISIYRTTPSNSLLWRREFGYQRSLGIFFQYCTAFLGMKMQQDEYKLLGYEAHINELDSESIGIINNWSDTISKEYVNRLNDDSRIDKDLDPIVNTDALANARSRIFGDLTDVLEQLGFEDPTSRQSRIAISALAQNVIERVILTIVKEFAMANVICVGGVFMNVKLNRAILNAIPGKLCVMPLAGDQGAGLGVYASHRGRINWTGSLCWGNRLLTKEDFSSIDGISVYSDPDQFYRHVMEELDESGFVNIVRGNMEFGARALCNTTTLALPTRSNTEQINRLNDRTTIMPMAPVMTNEMAYNFLNNDQLSRVHLSNDYMICAIDVNPDAAHVFPGAAHVYEGFTDISLTCRPQVISESDPLSDVIKHFGPLINTSFNYHGKPICYGPKQIIESHVLQNKNGPIKTLILENY